MKKIEIVNIKISNFKGIKELTANFDGKNYNVFGANGTGKTTLFDAFCWCLFGKDSLNQADFEIKPVVNGEPMHKAEHEVEVVLRNGTELKTFRRVFSEKWTTPRGQLKLVFTGHKTEYFIDSEPITQRKFNEEVSTLIDPKVFMLLSNPLYFNETLKWEQRREILLAVCGGISFEEIIASDKELEPLSKYNNETTLLVEQKVAKNTMSKIAKKIADIPVRISELQRTMPESCAGDTNAQEKLEQLRREVEDLKQQEKTAVAKVNSPSMQVDQYYKAYLSAKEDEDNSRLQDAKELRDSIDKAQSELNDIREELQNVKFEARKLEVEVNDASSKKEALAKEFCELTKKEFKKVEIETTCPTCGQDLPADVIQRAKDTYEKSRKEFNVSKAEKLESITTEGKNLRDVIVEKQKDLDKLSAKSDELSKKTFDAEKNITYIQMQLRSVESRQYGDNVAALKLKWEKASAHSAELAEASINEVTKPFTEAIEEREAEIVKLNETIAKQSVIQGTAKRIKELEAEEKILNQQHEDCRVLVFLCEKYTRRKIDFVSARLKDKFQIADFRLFKENISNDGVEECCEITANGVPYKSLNNAMRINIGMDVISTLIDHFGVATPIFIDNAESVTDLNMIDGKAQIIRLVVDWGAKQLQFEVG